MRESEGESVRISGSYPILLFEDASVRSFCHSRQKGAEVLGKDEGVNSGGFVRRMEYTGEGYDGGIRFRTAKFLLCECFTPIIRFFYFSGSDQMR